MTNRIYLEIFELFTQKPSSFLLVLFKLPQLFLDYLKVFKGKLRFYLKKKYLSDLSIFKLKMNESERYLKMKTFFF